MSPKSKRRRTSPIARRPQTPRTRTRERQPELVTTRYTPPKRRGLLRPLWHKIVGVGLILLGVALIVTNYIDYADANLLPGGHQEGYFLLGLGVASYGTWWLGLFDRTS